jgi:hypothetical protein
VPCLDGDDPRRRRERLGRDVAGLAVVGGDREVLQPPRGVDECVGVGDRIAEVVARLVLRRAAEHALDHVEVLPLVVEHLLANERSSPAKAPPSIACV